MTDANAFSGRPGEIPYDRGHLERQNPFLAAAQILHSPSIDRLDFAKLTTQPWRIIDVASGMLSHVNDAIETNPANPANPRNRLATMRPEVRAEHEENMKRDLVFFKDKQDVWNFAREWHIAASVSDAARVEWERVNPDKVQKVTDAVSSFYSAVAPAIEIEEKTQAELHKAKAIHSLENILTKTKEFVWDEFSDHPVLSGGLVVSAYLVYNMIKNTPLWSATKWGAAIAIGQAYLKQSFGFEITESIAEAMEAVGGKSMAKTFREGRDTVVRTFTGAKDDKAANEFLKNKLELHREGEGAIFDYMLTTSPRQFRDFYNQAKEWQKKRGTIPPFAAQYVLNFAARNNVPKYFQSLPPDQQLDALIETGEEVLTFIAERNQDPDGKPSIISADRGLALLDDLYVSGDYFDFVFSQFKAHFIKEIGTADSGMQDAVNRVLRDYKKVTDGMKQHVINASNDLTMNQVLLLSLDATDRTELLAFDGKGLSPAEALKQFEKTFAATKAYLFNTMPVQAKAIWNAMTNYITKTVPDAIAKEWDKTIKPALKKMGVDKVYASYGKPMVDWVNTKLLPAIADAVDAGRDFVVVEALPAAGAFFEAFRLEAAAGFQIPIDKARDIAQYWTDLHEAYLATEFTLTYDSANKKVTASLPTPNAAHTYQPKLVWKCMNPDGTALPPFLETPSIPVMSSGPNTVDFPLPAIPGVPPGLFKSVDVTFQVSDVAGAHVIDRQQSLRLR